MVPLRRSLEKSRIGSYRVVSGFKVQGLGFSMWVQGYEEGSRDFGRDVAGLGV